MDSSLAISSTFLPFHKSNNSLLLPSTSFSLSSKTLLKPSSKISITANYTPNYKSNPSNGSKNENPFAATLQTAAKTVVLTVAATLMTSKLKEMPAKAEPLTPSVEKITVEEEKVDNLSEIESGSERNSPLSHLLESNSEFVDSLWKLLQQKLELGEDEEALKVLEKLVEAQPFEMEWKFLRARLLSEMGKIQESREAFEDILALNPLSFEALFENALLMDRCGEKDGVIVRLEGALSIAMEESKAKEARDVRLIIAQIQFLQKNVEEAMNSYEELIKEDPKDFRPYFCKGMIYSLLDRNAEAREQFAKYRELSPKKFEVDGYLRTPLSRMKLFGTDSQS
ncbi:protein SLOW GREEN 1, chloroplastic [Beta vulgaris subsp. vulgaris]|uniref:protein SLOW GREEN 1, chloroplastic n=1 Tax=Beta vulgaris subsp. vulgaris TaxID=3555 RepID=UPI0020367158|nr:protein SLOW GREEN 1, chloroplastic [Beta vulgaris subsp. vulgaris]XP_048495034.1 protein SLOW GREEN 1, chloroplastic [Beta vulgaris subsp. vulgaris]XP_048495037.1 protein SLOW GREEN 1, chloroplastic [Beta vulgaris subsp. vulgaris]XP_048495044.1 protein SLOW GREEN 1, chloroplastic [Beta vulgaris subsp. vulgaris]